MTLVLAGKGLLLEGSTPKTKDKQVPTYIYIYIRMYHAVSEDSVGVHSQLLLQSWQGQLAWLQLRPWHCREAT